MSWFTASLLLIGVALGAGFYWYERTRPPARVVALLATLAALAVIGRIAFAPLPNVKPTTDIVVISGYALGGLPGFVVGAVTAVASNLFYGQGPHTPWQMFAWGVTGLIGAGAARAFGRSLGRYGLAAVCALSALVYGAIMNTSLWITFSGEHSFGELRGLFATAVPFDVAHVVGNVLFCLAFGPALAGAVARFRTRFEVTWLAPRATAPAAGSPAAGRGLQERGPSLFLQRLRVQPLQERGRSPFLQRLRVQPRAWGGAIAVAVVVLVVAAPRAGAADVPAAPLRYLERAQAADGGFPAAPGQAATQLHTGWAALGLAAAGRNPLDVKPSSGRSALDFIRAKRGELTDTGEIERTLMVLGAAGRPPDAIGRDLEKELVGNRRRDGSWAGRVNWTSFAVFALRAAGRPVGDRLIRGAGRWIAREANSDGGFNFATRGGPSGIDDTAGALQALVAAGRGGTATVRRAASFLARQQNSDGGFPLSSGGASNAQSTAFAVQAFVAAGRDPARVRRGGSRDPLAYLRSLIGPDGAVRYSRTSRQTPVWVTAQALLAFARKPFPLAAVPRRQSPTRRAAALSRPAPGASAEAAPARPRSTATPSPSSSLAPATPTLTGAARGAELAILTGTGVSL